MSNNNWKPSGVTPESVADFSIDDSEPINPFEEDDDIMIEPDVPSSTTTTTAKLLSKQPQQDQSSKPPQQQQTNNNNGNGANLFDFASYANPFNTAFSTNLNNEINSNIQVSERQFSGGNTLDESVLVTIKRDVDKIGQKLSHILWPIGLRRKLSTVQKFTTAYRNNNNNNNINEDEEEGIPDDEGELISKESILKILDWDLWGPLVITLLLSLIMTFLQIRSLDPRYETKASQIFSGSFTLIWASLVALSLNIQLLSPFHDKSAVGVSKGTISLSLFQCVSILGYAIFPVTIGGLLSIFIHFKLIRIIYSIIALSWSIYSTYLILKIINNSGANKGKGDDRIFLIVYPIGLVFGVFSWLTVIS